MNESAARDDDLEPPHPPHPPHPPSRWPRCRTPFMPASVSLPPGHGLAPLLRGPLWPARPAGADPSPCTKHCSNARTSPSSGCTATVTASPSPALRGRPAARARHRRQLFLRRQRPPDHRAATRTRRPARRARAGLDAGPRLATSPPTAMPRRSQMAASIKSRDAQDPVPILGTGRVLRPVRSLGRHRPESTRVAITTPTTATSTVPTASRPRHQAAMPDQRYRPRSQRVMLR